MPRRQFPFLPGGYYHFYNRGHNRRAIFFEADNYAYFLCAMEKYLQPAAAVLAYCLMPTHYHMLVRVSQQTSGVFKTPEVSTPDASATISRAMQRLLISYTKAINKRFGRVGTLFQGAFQAKPVRTFGPLLNLCIYIHANPVKDGLVASPEDWPYSDFRAWLSGAANATPFITQNFGTPAEYRGRVRKYIKDRNLPVEVRLYLDGLER